MSAAHLQEDAFTDDAEDTCPLCVEEFDLSDRNFKPCPCGYQVCQFCYNNIRNNMNGLCPACRRPYDDQSIEWKIISAEEQKAELAQQARKKAMARKRETEQKQAETISRKHLAGLRVVQRNLVYVVGLNQENSEDEFLRTLRGDQFFGQYGKITKIVVSKAKTGSSDNSVGVYVTFEKTEDAAKCIAAVDDPRNHERPLRAQYGTTKYCSAYLRNEACQNRNCTFLHEVGEDFDSFSRQDLSSMNAMSTQRSAQPSSRTQSTHSQVTHQSTHMPGDPEPTGVPALPTSANWASKNTPAEGSKNARRTVDSAPSRDTTSSIVTSLPSQTQLTPANPSPTVAPSTRSSDISATSSPQNHIHSSLGDILKGVLDSKVAFEFDRSTYSAEYLKFIDCCPALFADDGGLVRYRLLKDEEQGRMLRDETRNMMDTMSTAIEEDNHDSINPQQSDSLLREELGESSRLGPSFNYLRSNGSSPSPYGAGKVTAGLYSSHQAKLSLLSRVARARQSPPNSITPFQPNMSQSGSIHSQHSSNPFQSSISNSATMASSHGHARQLSRYTFSSDTASGTDSVRPVANPPISSHQAGIIPAVQGKPFSHASSAPPQQRMSQQSVSNFYSGVQGPPPGLKSATPPFGAGGMFGPGLSNNMGNMAPPVGKIGHDNTAQHSARLQERGENGQVVDVGKHSRLDSSASSDALSTPFPLSASDPTPAPSAIATAPTARPNLTKDAVAAPSSSSTQEFPSLPTPAKPGPEDLKDRTSSKSKKIQAKKSESLEQRANIPLADASSVSSSREGVSTTFKIGTTAEADKKAMDKKAQASSQAVPADSPPSLPTELGKKHQATARPRTPSKSQLSISSTLNTPLSSTLHTPISTDRVGRSNSKRGDTAASSGSTPNDTRQSSRRPSLSPVRGIEAAKRNRVLSGEIITTENVASRAASPSGPRVATRKVSKAQLKKDRQARARQIEDSAKNEPMPMENVETISVIQEAIVGRKKKAKKSKSAAVDNPATAVSTKKAPSKEKDGKGSLPATLRVDELSQPKTTPTESATTDDESGEHVGGTEDILQAADKDLQKQLTASALFRALIESGDIESSVADIFNAVSHSSFPRSAITSSLPSIDQIQLSQQDLSGVHPIIWETNPGRWAILLPDGECFDGYSESQANRFGNLWNTHQALFEALNARFPSSQSILKTQTRLGEAATPAHAALLKPDPSTSPLTLLENRFVSMNETDSGGEPSISSNPHSFNQAPLGHEPRPFASIADELDGPHEHLTLEQAEARFIAHKREAESIEKKLNTLIRKNRRIVLGGAH